MGRIIETEAGTIIGRVDRIRRAVAWSLVCPECRLEIPMGEREFRGQAPTTCTCGWATPVWDAQATTGPRWFDYESVWETVPAARTGAVA